MPDVYSEVQRLMGNIRYQVFAPPVTTMGNCPKCGAPSRGAYTCAACLGDKIDALLVGYSRLGAAYVAACEEQSRLQRAIDDLSSA